MEKVNLVVEFERRFERAAFIDVFGSRGYWESHDCELNRNTLYLYQCNLDWSDRWFGKSPKVRPMTDEEVDRVFWREIQWAKQATNTKTEIELLEPDGDGPPCFSCGKQMTLAPSEIVYECECGYWCYSSS